MKKFVIKLIFVGIAIGGVLVAVLLRESLNAVADSREFYASTPNRDVLVLGSSQEGCSIVEDERFHNKVLWISQTVPNSYLARLLELERCSALEGVKTLIIYFNIQVYRTYTDEDIIYSMYQELPLAWKSAEIYGVSRLSLINYIANNLSFPLHVHMAEKPPRNRPSVTAKSAREFEKFEAGVVAGAKNFTKRKNRGVVIQRLTEAYRKIKEICDRHAIRLCVVEYQPYPLFDEQQPEFIKEDVAAVLRNLKAMGIDCSVARRYPKSAYCDYVHLTDVACEQYTYDLYQDLGLVIKERGK